jgi:hypothetical protein
MIYFVCIVGLILFGVLSLNVFEIAPKKHEDFFIGFGILCLLAAAGFCLVGLVTIASSFSTPYVPSETFSSWCKANGGYLSVGWSAGSTECSFASSSYAVYEN